MPFLLQLDSSVYSFLKMKFSFKIKIKKRVEFYRPLTRARKTNRVGAPFVLPFLYMSVQYRYIYNRSKKEPREKTTLLREEKKGGKRIPIGRALHDFAQIFTLRRRPTDRLAPALSPYYIYSRCVCVSTLWWWWYRLISLLSSAPGSTSPARRSKGAAERNSCD